MTGRRKSVMPFFEKLMTFKIPRGKTTNSVINPRAL